MVHALRAPGGGVVPLYNLEFVKLLAETRLNVDTEILLCWDKDSTGRPPRKVTLARSSSDGRNVFDGFLPANGVITLPKAKGPDDFMKPQNILAIRETDLADNALSSEERKAIIGSMAIKALASTARSSLPNLAAFRAEILNPKRRRSLRAKKEGKGAMKDEVKNEEDDDELDEDDEDDHDQEETPVAKRRPVASPAKSSPAPMLLVVIGVANGNSAVAAVDLAIESNKAIHTLLVDVSKTSCEYAQQRVDKKVYTEWHNGKLDWNGQLPKKVKPEGVVDRGFNAAPLVIRNKRLRIPEALVEEFLDNDATRELADEMLQEHENKFHSGQYTLARLDQAKNGCSATAREQATHLPDPKVGDHDPINEDDLKASPGLKGWAVSRCEKYRIFVDTQGVFVVAQVVVGVVPGDRVGEFGSGGFRTPHELQEAGNTVGSPVTPVLNTDMDEIMLVDEATSKMTYLAFHTAVLKLLEAGTVSWPVQLTFHHIGRMQPKGNQDRTRFEITSTKEKVWVPVLKKSGSDDKEEAKTSHYANIFKHVRDAHLLNNSLVKTVWQVKVVPQLGLMRLERACVVWNCTMELKPGVAVRIG
jgi:hypothetical protein